MSMNIKILISMLFLMVLPFQKKKNKCLIISLKDNTEYYRIGTVGNNNQFYLYLKYHNIPKDKKENPLTSTGTQKHPNGVSYNLQNRLKIEVLPESIDSCICESLENFNLGMEFKLYVEKEKGWVVFDAKKSLVEE
ncbi:MAG: hypothetical protein ABR595_11015 [Psychroflexus sp.]